jgi:hypothetical protein
MMLGPELRRMFACWLDIRSASQLGRNSTLRRAAVIAHYFMRFRKFAAGGITFSIDVCL